MDIDFSDLNHVLKALRAQEPARGVTISTAMIIALASEIASRAPEVAPQAERIMSLARRAYRAAPSRDELRQAILADVPQRLHEHPAPPVDIEAAVSAVRDLLNRE